MVISRELKTLFVSSDSVIKQIPIQKICSKSYSNCVECVKDPHCGWNRETGECSAYSQYLIQDPKNEIEGICEASMNRKKIKLLILLLYVSLIVAIFLEACAKML